MNTLPCPACLASGITVSLHRGRAQVKCSKCGHQTKWHQSEQAAIEDWNDQSEMAWGEELAAAYETQLE